MSTQDRLLREGDPSPGTQPVPKPQHWNPTLNNGAGGWEVTEGEQGAIYVMRKTARKQDAIIPAGETTSTPVDISVIEHIGFVLPEAMTGSVLSFDVADNISGPWYRLAIGGVQYAAQQLANKGYGLHSEGAQRLYPWQYFRLVSDQTETAERTIQVHMK